MQLSDHALRTNLLSWARRYQKLASETGNEAAARAIDQVIEQYEGSLFTLAVLGKVKRGKSTLINALLGRRDDELAPIDKLPASSAISRFRWAPQEAATVVFRDDRSEKISYARIREFVTEEGNPQNAREVAHVEIAGPFPAFDRSLELIDTPGAASLHEHHDALLHAFIPQADAVIFLVTARMPLDQDELELLGKLKAADVQKIYFAVNRIDESSDRDLDDAIAHNRQALAKLGINVSQIYRISAKRAFEGKFAESHLDQLAGDLREFLAKYKGQVLADRFRSRILQSIEPLGQTIAVELNNGRKSSSELAADLERLEAEQRRIEIARKPSEDQFRLDWRRALSDFESQLDDVEHLAKAKVADRVAGTGVMGVTTLAQELPTLIQQAVEEELQEPAARLERRLQTAAQTLQASYPSLELGFLGVQRLRTGDADLAIKGAAGGAAVVAVGGGLLTAGQAAAIGIAAANTAAVAAATQTVAAPSLFSLFGTAMVPNLAGVFSFLGTGTATVSTPVALTATPLWVALSGPVGWTLIGLGAAAVPFAWRVSKLKTRDKLETASQEQIISLIKRLRLNRLSRLRDMADEIVAEFQGRVDGQLTQLGSTLRELQRQRPDQTRLDKLSAWNQELTGLLANSPSP